MSYVRLRGLPFGATEQEVIQWFQQVPATQYSAAISSDASAATGAGRAEPDPHCLLHQLLRSKEWRSGDSPPNTTSIGARSCRPSACHDSKRRVAHCPCAGDQYVELPEMAAERAQQVPPVAEDRNASSSRTWNSYPELRPASLVAA